MVKGNENQCRIKQGNGLHRCRIRQVLLYMYFGYYHIIFWILFFDMNYCRLLSGGTRCLWGAVTSVQSIARWTPSDSDGKLICFPLRDDIVSFQQIIGDNSIAIVEIKVSSVIVSKCMMRKLLFQCFFHRFIIS